MGLISNVLKLFKNRQSTVDKPTFENSPVLIEQLRNLLSDIEEKNVSIVRGIYSTSGHDNQGIVYRSILFANNCLDATIGDHSDPELINAFITKIKQSKVDYEASNYDPDGVASGTLVDVENALKKLLTED